MKYMCKDCKVVFSARNDNDVKWSWNYPVCSCCSDDKKENKEDK